MLSGRRTQPDPTARLLSSRPRVNLDTTVETAILEIELEDEGPPDGRPLLLLHGWPDAPRGWRPVARRLHERGWRTIAPALRGCGATRFRSPDGASSGTRGARRAGSTRTSLRRRRAASRTRTGSRS